MALETRPKFVGVLSCSGEEEPEGTIARNAVRLVMEKYRPGITVSLCLPLYLAGDSGEQEFAKRVPVIAVDGCEKACARLSTEKYSGEVSDAIDIRALLRQWGVEDELSRSHPRELEWELAERVAREIVRIIDRYIEEGKVAATNTR
ncbi:MAG: putative zinc-binding protein [Actinomycetota bacterium]|nr:putative zinc-binding protein [Actinomycetota bacterium]MDD5668346.1 putative zinc-binding protein [Actinomycetota bacterium]